MIRQIDPKEKITLQGFNNLTKCLSFNLYDFCVARDEAEQKSYQDYVSSHYNADKITGILKGICEIIEANVISYSDQNYDPWGASSLVLMSDLKAEHAPPAQPKGSPATTGKETQGVFKHQSMHLDKSHICAHTYPDVDQKTGICTFRVDIDIATCGEITPLSALNYMFAHFESDVVVVDYVVRGFTRDREGRRIYIDHPMKSIQDYIDPKVLSDYSCLDLAMQSELIWQTKMLRTKIEPAEYFVEGVDIDKPEIDMHLEAIKREMRGLVHMWSE